MKNWLNRIMGKQKQNKQRINLNERETDQIVLEEIQKGHKIKAIKRVREIYYVGLADAKKYVDKLEKNIHLQHPSLDIDSDDDLLEKKPNDQEVIRLLQERKKIQAIKLVREIYGYGLAEAKNYVDQLEQDHFN